MAHSEQYVNPLHRSCKRQALTPVLVPLIIRGDQSLRERQKIRDKYERDKQKERDNKPTHKLYTLRAEADGDYDVYEWGSINPVRKVTLKKGDIWKIGETQIGNERYSRSQLKRWGVKMYTEMTGAKATIKTMEQYKIMNYMLENNMQLPAGNKMIR